MTERGLAQAAEGSPSSLFLDTVAAPARLPAPRDVEADARRARFAAEWLVLLFALALVGAIMGWSLYAAREALDATERDRLLGQARVVDHNVGQTLDGMNRALASVRDDYLATPANSVSPPLSARLKALSEAIPGVRSIVLLDSDGTVVASSVDALLGRAFADREVFRAARDGQGSGTLYVGASAAAAPADFAVVVARAIRAPGGAFGGTVVAMLDPEYFRVLLRSVLYAPDMWVSLAHADGHLFATMPEEAERSVGAAAADFAAFGRRNAAVASRSEIVVGAIARSAEPRLTALRTIAPPALHMDKPLMIAISRSMPDLLAPWRQQARADLTFFAVLGLGAAFGLYRSQWRRRSYALLEAQAEQQRRDTAAQLELALQGADLGLWDWDVRGDRFTQNESLRLQLGYPQGELRLDGASWRALIHPDDGPRMLAAVEAHCQRDTAAYECEFRIRHRDGRWVWLLSRGKVVERNDLDAPLRMAGTHMDLSRRKHAESQAERSAQMLRRTGELANVGGWELDLTTMGIEWTDQIFRIHELDPAEPMSLERSFEFYAGDARAAIRAAIDAATRCGAAWDLELPFVTARGHARWVRTQGVAVGADALPARLLGTLQDITEKKTNALELQRLNEELLLLSTIDPLTQVGNRRLFDQTLKAEWARAARRGGAIALLMIDVDHFKEYNDHYGHPAGDGVLRRIAARIGESVRRGGELVARYGGEEFVLLLPGADLDDARAIAERCRQSIVDAKIEHRASATSAWVGVSIGVASLVAAAAVDPQALVETADAALYRAKRCGRGRIEF